MRKTKLLAEALMQVLKDDEAKVKAYGQLVQLTELMDQLKDYQSFLVHNPKEFAIVRQGLSDSVDGILLNFLEVVVQDGMVSRLGAITEDFKQMLVNERLLADIRITTARDLSFSAKQALQEEIKAFWSGPKVYQYHVDGYLIDGIRLKINDSVIDTSYRSRINQIIKEV